MKHIKQFENNIIRVLGLTTASLFDIETTLDSANQFNIKTNIYNIIEKGFKDSIVTFPDIIKDDTEDQYSDFINNGYGHNFYSWYSIKYVTETFTFIGTNMKEIEFYIAQNKYNL